MIYLSWLWQNFQQRLVDADDVVITQHARAHIMMLIGDCLMLEILGARIHFMYFLLLSNLTEASHYSWRYAFRMDLSLTQSQKLIHMMSIVSQLYTLY